MMKFLLLLTFGIIMVCMVGIGVAASARNSSVLAYIEYQNAPYIRRVVLTDVDRGFTFFPLYPLQNESLEWSPDGQSLLFVNAMPDMTTSIFTARAMQPVAHELTMGLAPAWSPDGREIAFASVQNGHWAIYLLGADGSNLQTWIDLSHTISDEGYGLNRLRWSPDGRWMSMETSVGLYLVDMTIPAARRLNSGGLAEWSPDSAWLVYQVGSSGQSDINTLNIETGEEHLLTENLAYGSYPVWSPNGHEIAFVCQPSGTVDLAIQEICLVDTEGYKLRFVPTPLSTIEDLVWSPDGARLAFSGQDAINESIYASDDIYVMNADGSNLRRVVDGSPANASSTYSRYFSLAWQPS
jgi:Tol biopolymer transport system component